MNSVDTLTEMCVEMARLRDRYIALKKENRELREEVRFQTDRAIAAEVEAKIEHYNDPGRWREIVLDGGTEE